MNPDQKPLYLTDNEFLYYLKQHNMIYLNRTVKYLTSLVAKPAAKTCEQERSKLHNIHFPQPESVGNKVNYDKGAHRHSCQL